LAIAERCELAEQAFEIAKMIFRRGVRNSDGTGHRAQRQPDGRLAIRYKGADLPYRTFDKIRQVKQAAVVENKRLGPLLEMIRQQQMEQEPENRSRSGPTRRDQTGHMFSVG
jgi:hypothetical protein